MFCATRGEYCITECLVKKIDLMQDIQIHKNLQDWITMATPESGMEECKGSVCVLETEGSSQRPGAQCSVSCKSLAGG